jgi:hypothetical protein
MFKKMIAPLVLAAGIAGAAGGVTYAASSHGSSSSGTATQAQVQTTPTATTGHACPHDGSTSTSSTTAPGA